MNEAHTAALYKILGNPERVAILRRLMTVQASLSQLGDYFGKTPANIRHHLVVLEQAGLVEFVEARPVQGGVEKYYRATQRALFIHQAVLPQAPEGKWSLTIGSMDPGINRLVSQFSKTQAAFTLLPVPLSSLDGLIALRQGLCQMSTSHLIDPETEEYNRPFVQRLFPSRPMALVQVFRREEGLMVKPGNPLGIRSVEDLARPDVGFVNREPGSGVRQWLDLRLNRLRISPESVRGYANIVHSHASIARAIRAGSADVGIGIAASARSFNLDFIPLFEEPYEIVTELGLSTDERYMPFFEFLNSHDFAQSMRSLNGYIVPQNFGGIQVVR